MTAWLRPALNYIEEWIGHQMRTTELPGCVLAVAQGAKLVTERAYGIADIESGEALTPQHLFRVASHSKTFTATAILKLVEMKKLRLDDLAGHWVKGLPRATASVTLAQLLSHSAGLIRDGEESPHWQDSAPFFDEGELRSELNRPLIVPANSRQKYSNIGFGLAGMVIEAVTSERYADWMMREIIAPAKLTRTFPDVPPARGVKLAIGHSGRWPTGKRWTIGGPAATRALASATGFTSTAGDLARFFAQLDPAAKTSIIDVAGRREMTRQHWAVPDSSEPLGYGLGTISGRVGDHTWFGHSGLFPGYVSRTSTVPDWGMTISIVTNGIDGQAGPWVDGALGILDRFSRDGAPNSRIAGWTGRWWSIWAPVDLVPIGTRVIIADPAAAAPLNNVSEFELTGPSEGRIVKANGFASYGERVQRRRGLKGQGEVLRIGGAKFQTEQAIAAEIKRRVEKPGTRTSKVKRAAKRSAPGPSVTTSRARRI